MGDQTVKPVSSMVQVQVVCPECYSGDPRNRKESREIKKRQRRCKRCKGTGRVLKDVPG